MEKTKISLCLIVKNEESNIKSALDGVQEYFDEICITDTGSTDRTLQTIESLPYKAKIKISHFNPTTHPESFFEDGHIFSFCRARDFNFLQATGDWILWMDADDTFANLKALMQLTSIAGQQNIDAFHFKYWYQLVDNKPSEVHWKLQFIRRSAYPGLLKWLGNVHEDLIPQGRLNIARIEDIVRIHIKGEAQSVEKVKRNLRILLRELEEQGDKPDPRTLFYAGRSMVCINEWDTGREMFEKYIEVSGWAEEIYEALYLLSECCINQQDYEAARKYAVRAIELRPDFPDCYHSMARTYLKQESWVKCIEWTKMGMSKPTPTDSVTSFAHRYTSQPMSVLAAAYLYSGKLEEAEVEAKKAIALLPQDKNLRGLLDIIQHVQMKKNVAKAYATIAGYLKAKKEEWKVPVLIGTAPPEMDSNPIVSRIKFDYCKPLTWPEKSIAILAFGTVEEWSPKNEKEGGIGGSEEAIINLSRELKKLGYHVVVYTNTGNDNGTYDGVVWKMYTEWNGKDEFDTIILWRATGLLEYDIKANCKLFDMHDVPFSGDWDEKRAEKVDRIMVKSKYHRSLFNKVSDDRFSIVGNGINPSHFKGRAKKEEFRCIYPSTIDRGLDILLDLWPRIRTEVPKATLHIFYGFKTYEELNKGNPERMRFLKKIKDKLAELEPLGVTYHGRVDHLTLAEEFEKSDLWLYPTYFPEIHCITALKAQKAGAIPVCTSYAALDETVQSGIKIDEDIYLPEVQDKFIAETVGLLKDKKRKDEIRKSMHEWADKNSWVEVAKKWDAIIKDVKSGKSTS